MSLVKQELLSLPEHLSSIPVFSDARVTQTFVFWIVFCRLLFVLLSIFFWSLCCLSFFDLQILITPWYLQNPYSKFLWPWNLIFLTFEYDFCTHIQKTANQKFVYVKGKNVLTFRMWCNGTKVLWPDCWRVSTSCPINTTS